MSVSVELRELAYTLWRDNHRNLTQVERRLKGEHKSPVSRVTLTKWRDEFGWEERAARAEAEAKELKEASAVETLLADLVARKREYDSYFETLAKGRVDNQATYAYAGLVKRIAEVQQMQAAVVGFDRPKFFLKNLQWLALWLKANDPDGLQVLARNIDSLSLAFKAECMNGHA